MKPLKALWLATLIALPLAACGNSDSDKGDEIASVETAEGTATVHGDEDNQSITITGNNGETATFTSGAEAASKLPDYAPAYPGAAIETSMMGQSAQGVGGMVAMVSADKPEAITDFYRKQMASSGLKLETEATTPQGMIVAGRSEDGRSLMVTVSRREDGKSAIALVAGAGN